MLGLLDLQQNVSSPASKSVQHASSGPTLESVGEAVDSHAPMSWYCKEKGDIGLKHYVLLLLSGGRTTRLLLRTII